MQFLSITVACYLLYFTVIILTDLARSRKIQAGSTAAGTKKIDFIIAEPQLVAVQEVPRPSPDSAFNLSTPAVSSASGVPNGNGGVGIPSEEEERSILEDLGMERVADGGIEVTEDNLLTIINQGL